MSFIKLSSIRVKIIDTINKYTGSIHFRLVKSRSLPEALAYIAENNVDAWETSAPKQILPVIPAEVPIETPKKSIRRSRSVPNIDIGADPMTDIPKADLPKRIHRSRSVSIINVNFEPAFISSPSAGIICQDMMNTAVLMYEQEDNKRFDQSRTESEDGESSNKNNTIEQIPVNLVQDNKLSQLEPSELNAEEHYHQAFDKMTENHQIVGKMTENHQIVDRTTDSDQSTNKVAEVCQPFGTVRRSYSKHNLEDWSESDFTDRPLPRTKSMEQDHYLGYETVME
jgi:hypothetical protein